MKNLLIAVGLLILFSCSSYENENPNIVDLQGTWELQSFTGGIGGWTTDLDTVDYTISLEVTREKAKWKLNDKVEFSYDIDVVREAESDFLLKFNPIVTNTDKVKRLRYLLRIEGNEMVMMDGCFDCYTYHFLKKKVGTSSPQ